MEPRFTNLVTMIAGNLAAQMGNGMTGDISFLLMPIVQPDL
jgi:hypothetical protein